MIKLLQSLGLYPKKPKPLSPEAKAYVEERLTVKKGRKWIYIGSGTFRAYLEKNAEAAVALRAKRKKELAEKALKQP